MSPTLAARHRRADLTPPPTRERRVALAVAVFAALAAALVSLARGPEPVSVARSLWIDVRDAQGRAVDPAAGELRVEIGGKKAAATAVSGGLERRRTAARIVLYVDQEMTTPGTLRRAAETLRGVAERLVALGDVEVVFADPEPEPSLASRDALAIGEVLDRTALLARSRHRALEIREQALAELAKAGPIPDRLSPGDAGAIVLRAVEEEAEVVAGRRDALLEWAAEAFEGSGRPHLLVLVGDGWDFDPLAAYRPLLDEATARVVEQGAVEPGARPAAVAAATRELGASLGAVGWTVLALAPKPVSGSALRVAEAAGTDASGGETGRTRLFSTGLFGRRDDDEKAPGPAVALAAPVAALEALATASGGEAIVADAGLRDALERFAERRELRVAASVDAEAGLVPLAVAVGSRKVQAPASFAAGAPPAVRELRVRSLLAGAEPEGIAVSAEVRPAADSRPGKDEKATRRELVLQALRGEPLEAEDEEGSRPAAETSGRYRIDVTVVEPGASPKPLFTRFLEPAGEEWREVFPIEGPSQEASFAVSVEELTSGRWGGMLANVLHYEGELEPPVAQPPVIEVLRPAAAVLRGRVRVEAQALDPRVARVVFLLDDEEVAEASRPPYSARLDFGRTPRRQEVSAVAYDAGGREIGRHGLVVNGGADSFSVTLVGPPDLRGSGAVEMEAKVAVPPERRLDRVLFFWNTDAVSTLYTPPFRQRVYVPPERPVGYVRAVALLDDGSVSEDVLFLNGPQAGERVDVRLVELYTVVTDQAGRPVRGLTQKDFVVKEDGATQELATFSAAGDLPLTVGLAIDSSASMFVKLPTVQTSAIRFLRQTLTAEDRVFVVDFDSQPRLARSLTGDLARAVRAVESLEASGRTALWESIVFSLVQLQGVSGRKALVVFSDGADEDDNFPFRSCLQVARRMGVPVYLIFTRREPRFSGTGLLDRAFGSRVDRLAAATGGRAFYTREVRDLGRIYDEIETELRSQYLLAYYARPGRGDGWRDVEVEVVPPGLTPRTLAGYWP